MREEQPSASVSEPATIHHHAMSQDIRPRSLSFPTKIALGVSHSQEDQDSFPREEMRIKKLLLRPAWAQESKGRPNSLDSRPNEGWARERPELRCMSLKGASIHNRVPTELTLDGSS